MALFGKKTTTCAICGKEVKTGFLRGLFQRDIGGHYVCDDCYGEVDLPTSFTTSMTLDQFRQYKAFQAENQKLKADFRITEEVDFGVLEQKFYFDTIHNRMCLDKNLEKTIFEGSQIRSFVIREDNFEIFRGSSAGLFTGESIVREQLMRMEHQIRGYCLEMRNYRDRLNRTPEEHKDTVRAQKPVPRFDTHPFHRFYVDIHLDHPYWPTITAELAAPELNEEYPDARDYLDTYIQRYGTMQRLAHALTDIAFGGVYERT